MFYNYKSILIIPYISRWKTSTFITLWRMIDGSSLHNNNSDFLVVKKLISVEIICQTVLSPQTSLRVSQLSGFSVTKDGNLAQGMGNNKGSGGRKDNKFVKLRKSKDSSNPLSGNIINHLCALLRHPSAALSQPWVVMCRLQPVSHHLSTLEFTIYF